MVADSHPRAAARLWRLGCQLRGDSRAAAAAAQRHTASAASQARPLDPTWRHASLFNGEDPFYTQELLVLQHEDRGRAEALLQQPTDRLARAVAPECMHHPTEDPVPPALWGSDEWERLAERQQREPLFDEARLTAQLDLDTLARDGVCILADVMTAHAQKQWADALERCQLLNDRLVAAAMDEWAALDWEALGRDAAPTESLAEQEIATALGGAQMLPQSDDGRGVRTLRRHGVLPEYCMFAHVPYLAFVLTHPQMLQLQKRLLRTDQLYFCTSQLNNKSPGYQGGGWHSHPMGGGFDQQGPIGPEEYFQGNLCAITLAYPNGFEAGDDGNLNIIRGSHLFRDAEGCSAGTGIAGDEEMAAGWCGKQSSTNPICLAFACVYSSLI
jgi:hypothetical protein